MKRKSWRSRYRVDGDGCHIWKGQRTTSGYGRVVISCGKPRVRARAHRYAYEQFIGPIADGLFVCHSCDKPLCVNPDHLWLGTHQDNMDDMVAKGRQNHVTGRTPPSAKLNRAKAVAIRYLRAIGVSNLYQASVFGVGQSTICDVIYNRTWRTEDVL